MHGQCGNTGLKIGGYYSGMHPAGISGNSIFWLTLVVLLISAIIIYFVLKHQKQTHQAQSPIAILDHAFAQGQISEEVYLRRKSMLQQDFSTKL